MPRRLVLAALALASAASAAAAQPPLDVTIGPLILAYDADEWQVEAGDEAATATCLAERCLGAIIAVTVHDRGPLDPALPYCDVPVAFEAADAAFPSLPRHQVVTYNIETLAVVLALSDAGYDTGGRAVFACIERYGERVEIHSRLTDAGPLPFGHEGVVYEFIEGFRPARDGVQTVVTTDHAALFLPADRFDALDFADNPERQDEPEGTWAITCLPPYCLDRIDILLTEGLAPEGMTIATCLPPEFAAPPAVRSQDLVVPLPDGPTLTYAIAAHPPSCRITSPPRYAACTVHNGIRYVAAVELPPGCQLGPYVRESTFRTFLGSIVPLPPG